MSEWKPLHDEAQSLLRAAAELRPEEARAELARCDDQLAALRHEMTELDGPARHRLSFAVTTAALLVLSGAGFALWLLGVTS